MTLNGVSVYLLYDVVSMFVNNVVCDRDYPYPDSTSNWKIIDDDD